MSASLVSVRAGRVRTLPQPAWARGASPTWRSAYIKEETAGRPEVDEEGIVGDEQYDRSCHGGPEMALLAYSADHYPAWQSELGRDDFGPGALGENLVIAGLDERGVCIGDTYQLGGQVIVQVASPRGPCANISRRWGIEDLLRRVTATGRTGWYLRVREPGTIGAGDPVALLRRPHAAWTVARVLAVRHDKHAAAADLAALAAMPELAAEWRERFAGRCT